MEKKEESLTSNTKIEPEFSIVLPVRNGGDYVKDCIHSILNQTYSGFNLIILDNNSSDGTIEWIRNLNQEKIILYTTDTSLTIEQSWARAVTVPKNEFITLIGHDDILHPQYLETMQALIRKYPDASLYQTHFNFIDHTGKKVRSAVQMDEIQDVAGFLKCEFYRTLDSTGTGYMMRSRDYDLLGGIPSYPNLIFADYELWVRLTALSYKATAPQICFSYRVHDSTSRTTGAQAYCDAFEQYVGFLGSFREENEKAAECIKEDAIRFLYYFCKALSHRLLKTPVPERRYTVMEFINKCRQYAKLLKIRQSFSPLMRPRILIAAVLDSNSLFRKIFVMLRTSR